ncbi:pyrroline-5-carboxylate reductase [Desulfocicer vacuolatum DSM 3385]|uniref:Pyrroline-5-carboxylate reductase n=1 Tax=Desulfocicer vacuolatum DSM 3385 TaxID=1121400 RepID=A0A1W2AVX0_9BACT|nr:pyrroline-5-carboxylate reductase [Desulfocicer vacuolatum]SMC64764.1 pyrroline-5-carboxylate reductase [Desulfocicer vacuolatum DSM 3385]
MRLGFVGTGNITEAIVTGLCTSSTPPGEIWVSPRNREKADSLASNYRGVVNVANANQTVLDNCDVVFLAILPQHKEEILPSLVFREDHIVVHLLAGTTIPEMVPLVKPAWRIVRAVPLPCTAIHVGPIAVFPDHEVVSSLFDPLGTVIAVDEEAKLETLAIITALLAPYYAMVETVVNWGEKQGIDRKDAASYTASMFGALSVIAQSRADGDLATLKKECMTPGGLNALAMEIIDSKGGFENIIPALEAVKEKVS